MGESKSDKKRLFFLIIIIILFSFFNENIFAEVFSKNRPIAVMIGNSPKEWKVQRGIGEADIIYEIDVEYPFTRLMALYFEDNNITIGPVRSSRYYFSRISIEWSAFFVHCGGQILKNDNVFDLDEMTHHHPFWRDEKIGGWINLFTDINKLKKEIKQNNPTFAKISVNHNLLNSNLHSSKNYNQINKITIKYNEDYFVSYHYNANERVYYRFINDLPQSSNGQENIKVSNIIIQYTAIEKIVGDQFGRIQVNLIGEGKGIFFHSGINQPIKWIKKNKDDQTIFYDNNYLPITLEKGLTWIHILSLDSGVWFK